jgi:hypothetical protein
MEKQRGKNLQQKNPGTQTTRLRVVKWRVVASITTTEWATQRSNDKGANIKFMESWWFRNM